MNEIILFDKPYVFCPTVAEWKKEVTKRDKTCRHCGRSKEHNILDAHHIVGRYGELKYILENGILFCRDFHRKLKDHPRDSYYQGWVRDLVGAELFDLLSELQKKIKWG